ncbi:MAG: hypothetical protein P1U87_14515 [Verrucomicrobiales bacterium]|nr:hypothetical protein [Verrucomicrobiales bacterium]
MRNSRVGAILIFLLLLLILLASFHFFVFKETYPVQREISNQSGQTIDALIQGRVGDTLHFDRLPGGERYERNLDELSWKDRLFAFRLGQHTPPVVFEVTEQKEKKKPVDPYIQNRIDRISELRDKVTMFEKEVASGTLSSILQGRRQDQLIELNNEIKELEVSIETYKWRVKK